MADGVLFDLTGFAGGTEKHKNIQIMNKKRLIQTGSICIILNRKQLTWRQTALLKSSLYQQPFYHQGGELLVQWQPDSQSINQQCETTTLTHSIITFKLKFYSQMITGIYSRMKTSYPEMEGPVRTRRGPKIFPKVCMSRPLLAWAWATLSRCVRRYCRVRRWWTGMEVEFSRNRLISLSWLPETAPSRNLI